jgi:hypothetical protein
MDTERLVSSSDWRSYFMSDDARKQGEKDVLWNLMDARKRLATATAKAQEIGGRLTRLGQELTNHPEHITVPGEAMDLEFHANRLDINPNDMNAGMLKGLCDTIRTGIGEVARYEEQTRRMGLQ